MYVLLAKAVSGPVGEGLQGLLAIGCESVAAVVLIIVEPALGDEGLGFREVRFGVEC